MCPLLIAVVAAVLGRGTSAARDAHGIVLRILEVAVLERPRLAEHLGPVTRAPDQVQLGARLDGAGAAVAGVWCQLASRVEGEAGETRYVHTGR